MRIEPEYKQYEVNYKFFLPDNVEELKIYQKANEYHSALYEIYNRCRVVWKYEDDANEEKVKLAEEIGDIVSESGVLND